MDIRQLELFLAVMEYGSVTRAAERVYLSPGAVSLQLHGLAADLRTELFIRSGKRFVPTPAASRLCELAKTLLHDVRRIEHEFANDPAVDTRPFHFATGATALIHRLADPLRAVRKQYPQAKIRITVAPTEEMVAGLLERRFDLALISMPYDETNLTVLPLYEEELLILRPSNVPVRGSAVGFVSTDELANAEFMLYPMRSNMRAIIDNFFRQLNITPRVITEADDTEALKRLVEVGFGYSILPKFALQTQQRFFKLLRVCDHPIIRTQALVLVTSEYQRALTLSIAQLLRSMLADAGEPVSDKTPVHARFENPSLRSSAEEGK